MRLIQVFGSKITQGSILKIMSIEAQSLQGKSLSLSDRLAVLEQLIEQLGPQSVLKVAISDDPMTYQNSLSQEGNIVYMYELVGSKSLRKTQNNNLLQKLEAMEKNKQQLKPTKYNPDERELQQQLDLKQASKPLDQNQKTVFRYFSENVKCFRCKKYGHYDYACLNEFSCDYCLSSQHHSEKCPQKVVCFRCYYFGHILNDCPYKEDGQFCYNCKRRHFDKCGFLMKGIQQVKQMFSMDGLYFNEQIKCLKCFKYGHFNCDTNQGSIQIMKRSYPSDDRNQRRQSRDRYQNLNKKFKY